MPNTDTFRIAVTVHDDYEEDETLLFEHEDYLSPGQRKPDTIAAVMRSAALKAAPEDGETRSAEAITEALGRLRAGILQDKAGLPATRQLLLDQLWAVADELNIEWWGVR